MNISEMIIGKTIQATLLVKSCDKKNTKPPGNKPYLMMTLSTGEADIAANKWDHYDSFVPEQNCILDVTAKVGDYQGKKQLTVIDFKVNTTASIADFLPKGGFEVADYMIVTTGLISEIAREDLRLLVKTIFNENLKGWLLAPSAKGIHHAYVAGNLKHSVDTALKAKALAECIPGCSIDLCIAGGLLHDLGKLNTYFFNQAVIEMSPQGMLMDHILLGIQMLEEYKNHPEHDFDYKVIELLQHIIASHHGEYAFGSPVTPKFIEALVVNYADGIDARVATLEEETKKAAEGALLTGNIWIFGNHPMFTQKYVNDIMEVK